MDKIRVALIYKSDNPFQLGIHHDNTYYHFFMDALPRNSSSAESSEPATVTCNQFSLNLHLAAAAARLQGPSMLHGAMQPPRAPVLRNHSFQALVACSPQRAWDARRYAHSTCHALSTMQATS